MSAPMKRFSESGTSARMIQAWVILVGYAHSGNTTNYTDSINTDVRSSGTTIPTFAPRAALHVLRRAQSAEATCHSGDESLRRD